MAAGEFAEARYLSEKRSLTITWEETWNFVRSDHRVTLFPLDGETVNELSLSLEMHDAIICATAVYWRDVLHLEPAVLTKDREIVESGLVRTIW